MAVSLYLGPPGSGKSYEAVASVMLPAFKAGRHIITNIKGVVPDYWAETVQPDAGKTQGTITVVDEGFFHNELNYPLMTKAGEVAADSVIPGGALVVIDEAYTVFPCGAASGVTPRMIEYIRTHRHFVGPDGVASDIVLISQDVMSLHSRIRAVAEFCVTVRNQRHLGLSKRYRVDIFNHWKMTKSSAIGSAQRKYDLAIFRLYKSFQADGPAQVVMTDKSHRALKPYHFVFLAAAVGLVIYAATRVSGAAQSLHLVEPSSISQKRQCVGSGALVDLDKRRVFIGGVWKDVAEISRGSDGVTRWDIGACVLTFR